MKFDNTISEYTKSKISPDWLPTDNHLSGKCYCQPDRNKFMQNITRLNWQIFTNLVYSILSSNRFCEVQNITRIVISPEWSINHQNDLTFTHLSKLVNITRLSILLQQTRNKKNITRMSQQIFTNLVSAAICISAWFNREQKY